MNTTFLSYLLVVIIIVILIIYLYQILQTKQHFNYNIANNKNESFIPIIFDTCISNKKSGMPVHRVGPILNFHTFFNKYNPDIQKKYITGIPEIGWRNYYLKYFNNYQVSEQNTFAETPIHNF
jgi:hypothetical protein